MTSELLGLGLLDKADVQNENPEWPAYKNTSCTEPHHIGLDTHDYGVLTANVSQHGFHRRTGIYIPAEGFGIL
jgi:Xaa-Pro aminopeptidase